MQLPDEFKLIWLRLQSFLNDAEHDHTQLMKITSRPSYDRLSLLEATYGWLKEQDKPLADYVMDAYISAVSSLLHGDSSAHNRLEELSDLFGYTTLEELQSHEWFYDDYGLLPEPQLENRMLPVPEIAKMLDCSARTIYRLEEEGLITLHLPANRIRGKFAWSNEVDFEAIERRLRDN